MYKISCVLDARQEAAVPAVVQVVLCPDSGLDLDEKRCESYRQFQAEFQIVKTISGREPRMRSTCKQTKTFQKKTPAPKFNLSISPNKISR
jgi:hypothetical protein